MESNPLVNTGVFQLGPACPISGIRKLIDVSKPPATVIGRPSTRSADRPRHLESRPRKSGERAYYWKVPTRDRDKGCFIPAEALGTDLDGAPTRAAILNERLDGWRANRKYDPARRISEA
jgi:hypothetical protein